MNRRTFVKTLPALTVLATTASPLAQDAGITAKPSPEPQPIPLPKPQTEGGKSVLAALKERKTIRNITSAKLPLQTLFKMSMKSYFLL